MLHVYYLNSSCWFLNHTLILSHLPFLFGSSNELRHLDRPLKIHRNQFSISQYIKITFHIYHAPAWLFLFFADVNRQKVQKQRLQLLELTK